MLFTFFSRFLQGMELELKKLEDTVKSIHDEMFYLRERYRFILNSIYTTSTFYD